jgi:hypothetical protein
VWFIGYKNVSYIIKHYILEQSKGARKLQRKKFINIAPGAVFTGSVFLHKLQISPISYSIISLQTGLAYQ